MIDRLTARLDRHVAGVLAGGMAPAAAVAVTDRVHTLVVRTYGGVADDALWQIGSIGKSFTAVVTLQLAEEGLVDLRAPVTDALPWFSVRTRFGPITLHHLLTHTSGIIGGSEIATGSTYDVIALRHTGTGSAPGARFHYSNVGYRAIGCALEHVTGRPYPDLVSERVLDRLGMRGSTAKIVHETRRRLAPAHTQYYDDRPWRPEHGLVPATWIESAEADGSVCCTAADMAVYLRAVMTRDERLLAPASWELMLTRHTVDEDGWYGYGVRFADGGLGHAGGMIGHHALAWAEPEVEPRVGAVAVVNGIGGASAIGEGALRIAQGGEPAPDSEAPPEPLVDDGSAPPEWAPFVGHYRSHNAWLTNFRVAARKGALWYGHDTWPGERSPLFPLEAGRFRVGAEEWLAERVWFDTVIDGRAQRAILDGAHYHRTFTP